jgi:hypothetical protein
MKSMRTNSDHAMITRNGLALWNTWHRYAAGCEQYYSTGRAGANSRWLTAGFFACAWCAFVAVSGQALAVEEIASFKQFNQLSREQSSEGRPARLRGVVLCYDLEWGQLYVHDGRDIQWFNPREISTQPASGQLVEITGKTTVFENYNALTNLTLTVLKEGAFPAAKPHAPAQLTNDLGQWVETSGRVRAVDFSRGRMQLSLHEGGQSFEVIVFGVPQTNALKPIFYSVCWFLTNFPHGCDLKLNLVVPTRAFFFLDSAG